LAVSLQVMSVINPVIGCHYFPPGLRLPPQPLRGLLQFCCLANRAAPILSVFPALIVRSELKSVQPGFPRNHENTMPETAFLGAQIASKLLSAGAFAPDPLGELTVTALPQTS